MGTDERYAALARLHQQHCNAFADPEHPLVTRSARDLQRQHLVGKRVRLVRCTDEYTRLTPGEEGVVVFVDDLGTLSVKWDSGSSLGLVPGEDQWEVID